ATLQPQSDSPDRRAMPDAAFTPQGRAAKPVPAAGLRLRRPDESCQPRAASDARGSRAENLQMHALRPAAGVHRATARGKDRRLSAVMVSAPGLEPGTL